MIRLYDESDVENPLINLLIYLFKISIYTYIGVKYLLCIRLITKKIVYH